MWLILEVWWYSLSIMFCLPLLHILMLKSFPYVFNGIFFPTYKSFQGGITKIIILSRKYVTFEDLWEKSIPLMAVLSIKIHDHWFRQLLVTFTMPSHYLNHCWLINSTLRHKVQWNLNKKTKVFLQESIFNTLRLRQNSCHFPNDIFKCIFLCEDVQISIAISLKFVPKGSISNIPALVQIMAWHWSGDKPLSEPMMVSLLRHIYVTQPQWVTRVVWQNHFFFLQASVLIKMSNPLRPSALK